MIGNPLDYVTKIDDTIEGVQQRLDETNALLSAQLNVDGETEAETLEYNPTPFEYATFPDNGGKIALPAGTTTFDFDEGVIEHESDSTLSIALEGFDGLSWETDVEIESLRSLFVVADVNARIQIGSGGTSDWFRLESCQYTPVRSQQFEVFRVDADRPYTLFGVASTRSKPFTNPDSVGATMAREAVLSSGTYDSFTNLEWVPSGLDQKHGDPVLETEGRSKATVTIENTSGNGNSIDVQLQGAATDSLNWHTLDKSATVGDGNHHVFHVEQSHHAIRSQVTNSTAGNSVSAYAEAACDSA